MKRFGGISRAGLSRSLVLVHNVSIDPFFGFLQKYNSNKTINGNTKMNAYLPIGSVHFTHTI